MYFQPVLHGFSYLNECESIKCFKRAREYICGNTETALHIHRPRGCFFSPLDNFTQTEMQLLV